MLKRFSLLALVAILPLVLVLGCAKEYGKVDQGRVIAYDKEKRMVTIISDKNNDPLDPDYSVLPPRTYQLPSPKWTGPEPSPGKLLLINPVTNEIVYYDISDQSIKTIPAAVKDKKENVSFRDSLVFDITKSKPRPFPKLDREKKTFTHYFRGRMMLITWSLPEEFWAAGVEKSGDEVRIYYREEGKARRFMNITKTDIYKR